MWQCIVCYAWDQAQHVVPKSEKLMIYATALTMEQQLSFYFFSNSVVSYVFSHSIQTWGLKGVHLLVGDGHDGVVEFLQKVGDSLVGQEAGHCCEHQVNDDEQSSEEVLHAVLTDSHRRTAALDVIFCDRKLKGLEIGLPDVI